MKTHTALTEPKFPHVTVTLSSGTDGNAYAVLGKVQRALRKAQVPQEQIAEFASEATSGDYDHLLQTVMRTVDVR